MANTTKNRGLDPIWKGNAPPLCASGPQGTSTGKTALFINSAVVYDATAIGLIAAGTSSSSLLTGAVTMLYDSSGAPAHNLESTAAGRVEYTRDPDQLFRVTCDSTQYAGTADNTKSGNLSSETATARSAGYSLTNATIGSHFSLRQLTSTLATKDFTEGAGQRQLWIVGISPQIFGNAAATAGTELIVHISPTNFN